MGFWAAALIGAGILGLVGLGATAYADFADDGEIFNGSIGADAYVWNTLVAASAGALAGGLIFTFGSSISAFLGTSFSIPISTFGTISTGGALALAGSTSITLTGADIVIIGETVVAAGIGIAFFSKAKTGPIRFSDGTGIDPATGKPVTDKNRAYEIYRSLKDKTQKLNWKTWMKGKGWRTNHLK